MTSDQKRGRQRDDRENLSSDEDAPEGSQHTRSGSDSDDDGSDEGDEGDEGKRARELEDDEAEALKRDLGQDLREGKRVRRAEQGEVGEKTVVAAEGPSAQSEQVWEAFKTQTEPSVSHDEAAAEEMVLVKRTYRFAGEEVTEEKRLPASHPDAIAFLASKKTAHEPPAADTATPTAAFSNAVRTSVGPRKKKSSLAAMSAAATGKPGKINTLEKSAMDWKKFKEQTADERERDEMEAQTKGGGSGLGSMKGYLERRGFLDRVQDRLEGQKKD